jgi:CubicO group peptidase (beta-lactamase class C family)
MGAHDGEDAALVPLPGQPPRTSWPTVAWPRGSGLPQRVPGLVGAAFDRATGLGTTSALVVVASGRLVVERYDGTIAHRDGSVEPVGPTTALRSWSMAKSFLHVVVGMAVADGLVDLDAPAGCPEWDGPDDGRRSITLRHLLEMRDGLAFAEVYEPGSGSDVVEMLYGAGAADTAAYAASRPLAAAPGTRFAYASGSSNLVARHLGRALGGKEAVEAYVRRRLFSPLGMTTARLGFDEAGTWVASSSLWASALDFARFGLFVLRGGWWQGRRLLPPGWVDEGRARRSVDPESGDGYGLHWWVDDDRLGTFRASGYGGQTITLVPARDLVVVRLGRTDEAEAPNLRAWRRDLVEAWR